MKSIFMVIVNAGDGSYYVEWHETMSLEKEEILIEKDSCAYAGGEGVNYEELVFPDSFDMEGFKILNNITTYEECEKAFA